MHFLKKMKTVMSELSLLLVLAFISIYYQY